MSHWPWDDWIETRVDNARVWEVSAEGRRINMSLNPEVVEWLEANVGPRHTIRQVGNWRFSLPITDTFTLFWFEDADKATIFKLTWG